MPVDATGDFAPSKSADRSDSPQQGASQSPAPKTPGRTHLRLVPLYFALALQIVGAIFFVGQLWSEILGLRTEPLPWEYQEYIEILASIGLVMGVITGSMFLRRSLVEMASMRRQIDVAAGNFQNHLDETFCNWQLSPSEAQVAVYAMKGFSNIEIAELRGTSASTIKSQMNAIFRKSGLNNRQQLIAFLVEELMAGIGDTADADS